MRLSRFVSFCLLLALALSSCSLPGGEQPVATSQSATSPTLTSAPLPLTPSSTPTQPVPAPIAGEPLDPLTLYRYQVATGGWTEGEGVVTLLDHYLGKSDSQSVPFSADLTSVELTSLLRLADYYLINGSDETAKAEILARLTPFNIPEENLLLYSEPEPVSGHFASPHLARPVRPLPFAQDELCADLFAQGFPAGDASLCFRYAVITDRGISYRLFYPASWTPAHPQWGKLALIRDALKNSVLEFNSYGPSPVMSASLVIAALPGIDADGNFDENIYAKAIRNQAGVVSSCRVGVFNSGLDLPEPELQQSIAHELFHCYQYTNLSPQESGPRPDANQWWVEGGAVFFSDIVYPSAGEEVIRASDVMRSAKSGKSLYEWSYEAFIFFEYLYNHAGWDKSRIIAFMRSMPTRGDYGEQAAAISAAAGMHDLFHGFAQKLVDGQVKEVGGENLATQYQPVAAATVFDGDNGSKVFQVYPLSIGFKNIVLPADKSYAFTLALAGNEGRSAVRPGSAGAWGALPPSLVVGCAEMPMQLILTTLYIPANDPHTLTVGYTAFAAGGACNACLYGKWNMDVFSYLSLTQSLSPAAGAIEGARSLFYGVTGGASMEFKEDGTMASAMDNLSVDGLLFLDTRGIPLTGPGKQNDRHFTTTVLNGAYTGRYTANDTVLSYSLSGTVDAKFYFDGALVAIPGPALEPPGGTSTTATKYVCSDTVLMLAPNSAQTAVNPNAPWLVFYKQQP